MYIRPSQRSYPRILVIDPDGPHRQSMQRILANHGIPSLAAEDCCAARSLIEDQRLDLVIVPALALAGDGAALRAVLCGVGLKVIVTADRRAWQDLDFLDAANELGASAVLQKPFTGSVMMQAIVRTLASAGADDRGDDDGDRGLPDRLDSEWADFDWRHDRPQH